MAEETCSNCGAKLLPWNRTQYGVCDKAECLATVKGENAVGAGDPKPGSATTFAEAWGSTFFTKIAFVLAFAGAGIGVLLILVGFGEEDVLTIIAGISGLLGSMMLGVLAEISISVSALREQPGTSSAKRRSRLDAPMTDPEERRKWANREPPYDKDE